MRTARSAVVVFLSLVSCRLNGGRDTGAGGTLAHGNAAAPSGSVAALDTPNVTPPSTKDPAGTMLHFEGKVTDAAGVPVAKAHVALTANPSVTVDTAADGSFSLSADDPHGFAVPPRYPASRPIEHTIVASKPGFAVTYRGVAGAQASGLAIELSEGIPSKVASTVKRTGHAAPSVALYRGDRLAAVTMTFDDTHPSQITLVRPLFDQYGYKGTFYINSGMIGGPGETVWSDWAGVAAAGHEIGNHSRPHWVLPDCDPASQSFDHDSIFGGHDDIIANLGVAPLTFAFPAGGQSDCTTPLVTASGHIDFRRNDHILDTDRLYPEGDDLTIATGTGFIDQAIAHTPNWNGATLSWFLFYMHDVTSTDVLEAMLDYIADKDADVWCTGYGEVTIYEREREQTKLEVVASNARGLTLRLTNTLDPSIFHEPLTVIVPIDPSIGAIAPTAVRETVGWPVEVRARPGKLLVDAVPGPTTIRVSW